MSADTKNESSQTNQEASASGSKGSIDLAELKTQLAELAENQKVTMEAVGTLARGQRQPEQQRAERNLFEPNDMLAEVQERVDRTIQLEAAKNLKIAEMSREYPELNADAKMIQSVVTELGNLPAAIRNTPDGYEVAMLKAASKAGLIPKSKRKAASVDDDISMGNSGGAERRAKSGKIDDATLAAAELMGININDPEVLKRMEQSSKRNFNRYE